ncbi:polyhydroxyalkanoate depolymerase [Novosphingobium mangrovi (ex Hu et al. 2023)]|uniref:Polyhydroxyalkanoate depolymerase n=1 Tax=Novosphingobium mangrovi (ex Hu et al. 2023) TaxID=2930094 RepID=A0ABT0ACM0_9SPHN|nr:polyhydroxyalkanoate depolymerase [Novosphingobium mangrovi (ex Hu et al. 2023)]MCJ1960940.1 polyhydroxyalkanoate depolymerase [Novosphingobium mangrovi (ex Hu et al. 2023)]
MLYNAYELQRTMLSGAAAWASVGAELLTNPSLPMGYMGFGPYMASALDVFAHATAPRGKPTFDIESVEVDGTLHAVTESIVLHRPFGNLLRFERAGLPKDAPRLLIAAPMSGHYATLLRGTVARMVESSVVYITDWADAKMVPESEGRFDLDDYIDYLIGFLEFIGPNTHMLAVCQPSVPAFAAAAVMGKHKNPCRPATLTMMGGPIDTREAPTSVNDVAMNQPLSWFKHNVIATVPLSYPGAGREVYPGFLQLAGFMAMNLGNHMMSHYGMFKHLVEGDGESAGATKAFYDEYRSVCDMTADFYLQTVEHVFQKHSLPKGEFVHRGEVIDPGAIRDTALLAVEGEKDDISGIGQTRAALHLAPNLPEAKKRYYLAEKVGHYGIFNGSKWRGRIAPVLEDWMRTHPAVETDKKASKAKA